MFLTQCKTKIIKPCWKKNIDLVESRFFLVSFSYKYRDIHFLSNLLGLSWKSWEYRQKLCAMAIKRQTATWHPREESLPRMLWCQAYKGMFFFLFKTSNHRRIRSSLLSSLSDICLFVCLFFVHVGVCARKDYRWTLGYLFSFGFLTLKISFSTWFVESDCLWFVASSSSPW